MSIIREIVEPEEGLVYKSDEIQLKIGELMLGIGNLYVSEEHLSWKPLDKSEGISIIWKQISLHGVSSIPQKSVYLMLDHVLIWPNVYDPGANGNNLRMEQDGRADDSDNDEGHESDCDEDMTELWLIPSDPTAVDAIFQAMKECQSLHPDSADSISEESDFMDAVGEPNENDHSDDEDNAPSVQQNNIEIGQGDGIRNLNINEDRFADADD